MATEIVYHMQLTRSDAEIAGEPAVEYALERSTQAHGNISAAMHMSANDVARLGHSEAGRSAFNLLLAAISEEEMRRMTEGMGDI